MKDLQILWAAFKYHWRRFTKLFKEQEFLSDGNDHYYYEGSYQKVLYMRAYRRWQDKRCERGEVSVGTDLFEANTNIKYK